MTIFNLISAKTYFSSLLYPNSKETSSEEIFLESESYGPKHENLLKSHSFVEIHKLQGVKVPLPFGLGTNEVKKFLMELAPQFFTYWEQLKNLYEKDPEHFLENEKIDDLIFEAKKALKEGFAFHSKPWDTRLRALLNLPSSMQSQKYYMVRSSGAEDGKASNAGGNRSINYVLPENIDVAIAEVLESYIDKRSLQNQILAGENPFAHLRLSVTIQELIGEPMGGEKNPQSIPISVVLNTNEPLYTNHENFRILRLSATFGHGEGVVNNEGIGTDSVFVLQSRIDSDQIYIVYDRSSKPIRLAPIDGKLQPLSNPSHLIDENALDEGMIKRLFILGLQIEEGIFHGQATDIELVIKNDIIYLVQARPINRQSPTTPFYLDASQFISTSMKILVPGHSQAFFIDDASQLLCVDTLEEAQDYKGNYKLIVVKQDEPINSHPIVNFSERGIPCFFCPNGLELPLANHVLAVCPQQGIVGCIPATDKEKIIKKGYIEHPAPVHFTQETFPHIAPKKELLKKVDSLITEIKTETSKEKALAFLKQLNDLPLLEKFKQTKAFAKPAMLLDNRIRKTLNEWKKTIKKGEKLETLFYAKVTKALFHEALSLHEAIEKTNDFEEEGIQFFSKEALIETMDTKTQNEWKTFLMDIEKIGSPQELDAFQRLLDSLGELKSLWLLFYFSPKYKTSHSSQELLHHLLSEMDEQSYAFIESLKHKQIAFYQSEDFIASFKQSKPIAKLIALHFLSEVVDKYDKSLKAFKLRSQPMNTKVSEFKQRLIPYLELLRNIAFGLVREGKFYTIWDNTGDLTHYFGILMGRIEKIFSAQDSADLLKPSLGFNVAAAQLRSGKSFVRNQPRTLEDLFTLAHRNLLACIGLLYQEILPDLKNIDLPPLLIEAKDQINALPNAVMNGIEQKGNELTMFYSIPLNVHGSTCQLKWEKGTLHFSAQMLGEFTNRWATSAAFLRILHHLNLFPFEKIKLNNNVLDVTWEISTKEQMQQACQFLNMIFDISYANSENSLLMKYLSNLYLNNDEIASQLKNLGETSSYKEVKELISFLLKIIDNKNAELEKIIKLASSINPEERLESTKLLNNLIIHFVKTKQDYDQTLKIATMLADDEYPEIQKEAMTTLISFVREGKGQKEAIDVVMQLARSPLEYVRKTVASLLYELLKNGMHQNIMLEILEKDLRPEVVDTACRFIKKLASKIIESSQPLQKKVYRGIIEQLSQIENGDIQEYARNAFEKIDQHQRMLAQ